MRLLTSSSRQLRRNYSASMKFVPRCDSYTETEVDELRSFLQHARRLLVLTGAGISTESGIPDYRSEGVGLYARSSNRPVQIQQFLADEGVRRRYWARNFVGWPGFSSVLPNSAHRALQRLERWADGKISCLVTQNVDRLHHKAGSARIVELHGTAFEVLCMNCKKAMCRHELQRRMQAENPHLSNQQTDIRPDGDVELALESVEMFKAPLCGTCGGIMKPDIVFFGDNVPRARVDKVYEELRSSDALLVIGSSLQVAMTVSGHGRLLEPPSRSTMWRFNFNNPVNYNDMELFCGGFTRQHSMNGGKCGICGDAWDAPQPRPNEAGGLYANGIVVATYGQGDVVRASVELTAAHKGHFEFRACPAPADPTAEVTQECLDQHPLELADGSGAKFSLPPGSGNGIFTIDLRLPSQLTCQRCVFQWIYKCGNNWGICPNGTGRIGCGNQEEFRGCADIAILQMAQGVGGAQHHVHQSPGESEATTNTTTTTTTIAPSSQHHHHDHSHHHHHPVASGAICWAVGMWAGVPGMHQWCVNNCLHVPPHCPASHCSCQQS